MFFKFVIPVQACCLFIVEFLTKRLPQSQSQTEVTQTQVGLHFLDGRCHSYWLVQNTKSPRAMAWERGLQGVKDGKLVEKCDCYA